MTNLLQSQGTFPSQKTCLHQPFAQVGFKKIVTAFATSHRVSGLVQQNFGNHAHGLFIVKENHCLCAFTPMPTCTTINNILKTETLV